MDLVKAILTLGELKERMSYEEFIEAKNAIIKLDDAWVGLGLLLSRMEMDGNESFERMGNDWSNLKDELIQRFDV